MATVLEQVTVNGKANVYFDGKCISHSLTLPDGSKKSVGVILPATLTFTTGVAEIMETVAGACRYRLAGANWQTAGEGECFAVSANSRFDIEVVGTPYHYICHFA